MVDFDAARNEILNWLAETLRIPAQDIDLTKSFAEIGVDSLDAVHMVATIESIIQRELPEDVMRRVRCLNDIFDMMQRKLAAA